MSESNQPFTDYVTRRKAGGKLAAPGWPVVAALAVVALVLLALLITVWTRHQRDLEALRTGLSQAKTDLAAAAVENQTNQDLIASLKGQVADLEKQKENVMQMSKALEDEMRSDLESKDVTISRLQGKLTVNILDRVLFDSGEADLKPEGEEVMRKIAALLVAHSQLKIHVIGHTDNVPFRSAGRKRFASNWELSTARALAAVHFLTEQAGVDPRRVGALGYGEFHPVADNATAEGRAKNRRIAITILPDELAQADTTPAVKATASTNAPPEAAAPEANAPAPQ